VRSFAPDTILGAHGRQTFVRLLLGLVLLGAVVWALPIRRPGETGGHRGEHAAAKLDAFERAGITEFKDGQRGPAFRLPTLDNRQIGLDDYRESVVVLNFWATWCQPCTFEMPTLEALWTAYRDRGIVVLGIAVDRGAPRSVLEPYVRNLELTFPILLDADLKTAGAWRVTALPATFIVKPGGDVAGMAVGAREWNSDEMRALLESLRRPMEWGAPKWPPIPPSARSRPGKPGTALDDPLPETRDGPR
jgi:peroxiredoxin